MKKIFYSFTLFLFISLLHSQPKIQENSVVFTYTKSAKDVFVAGDFNGWTKDEIRLQKKSDGTFSTSLSLKPGIYQYKFFVDGKWKIKQYVLSITIPNDTTDAVIKIKSPIEDALITDLKK